MRERKQITDDDFLALWAQHGRAWSWAQYADALSDRYGLEGGDRFGASAVSARVSRRRKAWAADGVHIPLRRVSHAEMFSAWPDLPARLRDQFLYRFLEYEHLFQEGRAVPDHSAWSSMRREMVRKDELIRYDPKSQWLYRDKRSKREIQLDPRRERFVEPRESYLSRHPEAGCH